MHLINVTGPRSIFSSTLYWKCWDVLSPQTLSHDGGGNSQGIVSMVKWTLARYNGDARKVFSIGTSSGAMMTNVLLSSYHEVFAAGSAWAGVAFSCYASNGYAVWSDACATGQITKTGAEWKTIVEAAYPGYHSGWRPKMQIFHGTADTILHPQNLQEEIKEWTAVLDLPSAPVRTLADSPQSGWTTYVYGDSFTAKIAQGVDHNIQTNTTVVLDWFDLTCIGTGRFSRPASGGRSSSMGLPATSLAAATSSKSSTSKSPTSTSTSAATTATGTTQAKYQQCGGAT
ncbi:putative acetylxylan esterase 1 precursor [Drepanopeziza brunnea f. sp. 'multigermtubi' MB_m1]|uniref:Putative acetylxylan esterase 1 n=1 Tax=Marssonina brunnea f. sp. multigermtubi (strain MB_m1) TaxID=1072389 RepID=K1WR90_MARBU|nr:putative acetylxylan esterase 1 precursor [Drepanopeziza brunnea f. sp. 'multigermtubi' MB_m1]EKD14917.1 putative acetylxylan esterase 1 precursor [Drepanopeziza brunnea f. sp. 'multigermtubi' MB_m1]